MSEAHRVSAGFFRAIVALAVVPCLGWSSVIPQEHVHEADLDHPHSIVHRHADAHTVDTHDHDGAEIGQDEERIVWLTVVSLEHSSYRLAVSWIAASRIFEAVGSYASWVANVSVDGSPPHGPPRRCLSLRAPPPAHLT
jgi:hypothetical protein